MTDQNLPSHEAVREALKATGWSGHVIHECEKFIHAYLTQTDEGRVLVADASSAEANKRDAERWRIARSINESISVHRHSGGWTPVYEEAADRLADAAIVRQESNREA